MKFVSLEIQFLNHVVVMEFNVMVDFSKCEVLPLFKRQDLPRRIDRKRREDGSIR